MHLTALWTCLATLAFLGHALRTPVRLERSMVPGGYLVQFKDDSQPISAIREIVETLKKHQPSLLKVAHEFDHPLFRGVSLRVHGLADEAIRSLLVHSQVASVHPVVAVVRPQIQPLAIPAQSPPDLSDMIPHAMTQVDRVHRDLNNTGQGIVIGIIDSGVDYYHPALGGGFGPGYKVQYGRDLVGSNYNSSVPNSAHGGPTPLDDCGVEGSGHGTHVSGIIGGKSENFTGVAPDATLGMWRVFGCTGDTSEDIIIQAMLEAYDAGCDIISMSLGSSVGWSEDVMAVVAQRIVEKGTPVVVAAGNDGAFGAFTVGSPSTGEGVLSVGSFDNNYNLEYYFTIASDPTTYEYSEFRLTEKPQAQELVKGYTNDETEGCDPSTIPDNVKGKYVLLQRGICTFDVKAENAAAKGATGLVVYNNVAEPFTPATTTATIPVIGVAEDVGNTILSLLTKQESVLLHFGSKVVTTETGNTVSSFSSVGPTYEGKLNPQIAGVGGYVYSTLPRAMGSWGIMSGTSMATPYVSGSIALYLKSLNGAKPTPAFIAEQFQNYAYKTVHENGKSDIDSPLRQGAGLVQVYDAIQQAIHVSPGFISLNDTSSPALQHVLTITNKGSQTVSYQLVNNVSVAVAPYNLKESNYSMTEPASFVTLKASVAFSSRTVIVRPGASQTVKVTVKPPPSADPAEHIMYGGYVQFKSRQDSPDISVPYFGIAGNQRELPITSDDTPFLSNSTFNRIVQPDETYQFNIRDESTVPFIVFRIWTPTARIVYEVLTADSRITLGKAMPDTEYLSRNTESNPYVAVAWSGTVQPKILGVPMLPVRVLPGTYRLRFKALKLYGDPKKESDWEVWVSPRIRVH